MVLPSSVEAKPGCQTKACRERVHAKHMRHVVAPYRAKLMRIALCESGMNGRPRWRIVNPPYESAFQFTASSWRAAGGRGSASHASPLEQQYRAVRLMRLQGWGAWPRCGRL